MKNTAFMLLAMVALVFSACKKDKEAPEITLTGDSEVEVALYGTYTEQGATAVDEKDGDLTASIAIVPNIDVNTLGDYTVSYTVMDEAGNTATRTRMVSVVMKPENYAGDYTVTSTCSGAVIIDDEQTCSVSGNEVSFNPLYTVVGGTLTGTVSGQNITVPSQTVGTNTVVGTGNITDDAGQITLNLTFSVPIVGDQTCVLTYDRN
ncbi:MAG: DUF5011 domain-containing protein [Bacteroidota bacterium]